METKRLDKSHIPLIMALEQKHAPDLPFYGRYNVDALQFIFDYPDTCGAFGIFDQENLIGWGAYRTGWNEYNTKEEGICEVSSVVVNTDYRKRGLGKLILNKIIDDIKARQNYKYIYLTVSPLNKSALILYLRNNFTIYDFKRDVYGPGADRLYLKLEE